MAIIIVIVISDFKNIPGFLFLPAFANYDWSGILSSSGKAKLFALFLAILFLFLLSSFLSRFFSLGVLFGLVDHILTI